MIQHCPQLRGNGNWSREQRGAPPQAYTLGVERENSGQTNVILR